jgi:hypothetical protein
VALITHKENFLYRIPFYPFLIGLYPVLFLWQINYSQVQAFVIPPALLLAVEICVPVYLVCWLILRHNPLKAAALAGLALFMFYTYGALFAQFDNLSVAGHIIGRHRYTLPAWLLITAVAAFFIIRSRSNFHNFNLIFNLVSMVLVMVTLAQIGYFWLSSNPFQQKARKKPAETTLTSSGQKVTDTRPDVYYILMDAFSRQDLLQSEYHLDDSAFIKNLQDLGFTVPDCTQSNYINTEYSMSATLNMNYLDGLGFSIPALVADNSGKLLIPIGKHNLVFSKFEDLGYQTVAFHTAYPIVNITDADIYYDFEATSMPSQRVESSNFRYMFFKTTMMRVMIEAQENSPQAFSTLPAWIIQFINPKDTRFDSRNYRQYQANLYNFDMIEKIPGIPGKKFVYAHLLATHPPFTFTPTGGFRDIFQDTPEAYRDQVQYVEIRQIQMVKTLLAKSTNPPVIIIQGDHGYSTNPENLPRILNAYYLPGNRAQKLYPSITPVNTFRLILNTYFGGNYSMLPDNSYWLDRSFPGGSKLLPKSCVH